MHDWMHIIVNKLVKSIIEQCIQNFLTPTNCFGFLADSWLRWPIIYGFEAPLCIRAGEGCAGFFLT